MRNKTMPGCLSCWETSGRRALSVSLPFCSFECAERSNLVYIDIRERWCERCGRWTIHDAYLLENRDDDSEDVHLPDCPDYVRPGRRPPSPLTPEGERVAADRILFRLRNKGGSAKRTGLRVVHASATDHVLYEMEIKGLVRFIDSNIVEMTAAGRDAADAIVVRKNERALAAAQRSAERLAAQGHLLTDRIEALRTKAAGRVRRLQDALAPREG